MHVDYRRLSRFWAPSAMSAWMITAPSPQGERLASARLRERRRGAGRSNSSSVNAQPCLFTKPCRQLGYRSSQPSSRFAFAFEAPRDSVVINVAVSQAARRASQRGNTPWTSQRRQLHDRQLLQLGTKPGRRSDNRCQRELRRAIHAPGNDILDGRSHVHRRPQAPGWPSQIEHSGPGQRPLRPQGAGLANSGPGCRETFLPM